MKPFVSTRPQLSQNAIFWPATGVYLKSIHVHDYTCHSDVVMGICQEVCCDGGLEYRRVCQSGNPVYQDFSLWSDSPFELVADRLLWGTYGPKGDQPRRWVPLKECETDHLQAILRTQPHVYGTIMEKIIKHILKERGVEPFDFLQFCKELGEAHLNLPQKRAKLVKKPAKKKARK